MVEEIEVRGSQVVQVGSLGRLVLIHHTERVGRVLEIVV